MRGWIGIVLAAMSAVAFPATEVNLSPSWGVAGTQVTATVASACDTAYTATWQENSSVTHLSFSAESRSSVTFAAPQGSPGKHRVTIRCEKRAISGERIFTLIDVGTDAVMAAPGSSVTVSGSGFVCMDSLTPPPMVTLSWAGQKAQDEAGEDGRVTVTIQVPKVQAGPGEIEVFVGCPELKGSVARIPINVPSLDLVSQIAAGSELRIAGKGFSCGSEAGQRAGPLRFAVDGTVVRSTSVASDGAFTDTLPLPADLKPGEHRIEAFCDARKKEVVTTTFTIPSRPALARTPSTGTAGSRVTVNGTGLSCTAGSLSWDGEQAKQPVTVAGGIFSTGVAVPADSRFARRQIVMDCGRERLTADFDVVPREPRLAVHPGRAMAGAQVDLTGTGYDCGDRAGAGGDVVFMWGAEVLTRAVGGDGRFSARLVVARDAKPGVRTIEVACSADGLRTGRTQLSVEVADRPTAHSSRPSPSPDPSPSPESGHSPEPTWSPRPEIPTLRLHVGHGERGDRVRVEGTDFACPQVDLAWSDRTPTKVMPVDGAFIIETTVPSDLADGRHDVVARCPDNPELITHEQFDILPTTEATLELVRGKGPPGSRVTAIGHGFPAPCISPSLHFDKETRPLKALGTVPAGGEFTVPDRDHGTYTVELVCAGLATASAAYTIPEVWVRSELAASIRGPGEVSTRIDHIVGSLVIGAIIMLLLGFPAEIFNKAYENSRGVGTRSRKLRRLRDSLGKIPVVVQFAASCAAGAGLLTLVAPPGDRTGRTALAFLIAFAATTLTFTVVNEVCTRWLTGEPGSFRVLPGGLAVAAVCALASRWLDLHPGYVYGLITVFVFLPDGKTAVERGDDKVRARAVLVAAVATLLLSLVAWLAWIPSHDEALRASADPTTLLADAVFATVFVMGVQSVLFGLIPLPFLDGYKLSRWSWPLWGATVLAALLAFVHIVYGEESEKVMEFNWPAVWEMLAFFVAFAVLSLAYYAFVRIR